MTTIIGISNASITVCSSAYLLHTVVPSVDSIPQLHVLPPAQCLCTRRRFGISIHMRFNTFVCM